MCERRKIMWFLLCALVQVASVNEPQDQDGAPHLLLCALVQVASKSPPDRRNSLRASALRTCASCFDDFEIDYKQLSLLLCALVQVASLSKTDFVPQQFNFCSVHLCKLLLAHEYGGDLNNVLLLCALVQVASGVARQEHIHKGLLLCALVQVASCCL